MSSHGAVADCLDGPALMSQSWTVCDGLIKGGWHFKQHKPCTSLFHNTFISGWGGKCKREIQEWKRQYEKKQGIDGGKQPRHWKKTFLKQSGSHIEICSALSCLLDRSAAGFPQLSFSYWWQHERTRLFQHIALPHYWAQPAACSSLLERVRRWRQGIRAPGHPSWEVR